MGEERKLQVQELEKLHLEAFENATICKEKTKTFHDKMVAKKTFTLGKKCFFGNLRLKLMPSKLRSRWKGPFVVTNVCAFSVVEMKNVATNKTFKVNWHMLKHFYEEFQKHTM